MKKLFVILLAGGVLAACGTRPEAVVKGTVEGVADGTVVNLLDVNGEKLDSATVAKGKFRFEVAEVYPDRMILEFDAAPGIFPFIIEPGTIVAKVNFEGEDGPVGLFSGTPANDGNALYEEGAARFDKRMRDMVPSIMAAQGTPAYDSLLAVYMGIEAELRAYTGDVVREDPNSLFAAYLAYLGVFRSTDHREIDSVLTVVAGAPENRFTERLKSRRDDLALTGIGVEAPDFTQAQPDGTPLSLSSLRGKLVLIDFWASWCGPCRAENPNVVKVYNEYKEKGFEILGVSLDQDRDSWLEAIAADGLVWKHVSDLGGWSNAVAKQYAVRSIPHTVLVDANGVIIAKNLRGAALKAKIAEVLDAK